jgi:hypothetical protein
LIEEDSMAVLAWKVVAHVQCGQAEPAELLEQRLYASDFLDDVNGAYQVRAQTCAQAEACREAGLRCRWTGQNPNYDPFKD